MNTETKTKVDGLVTKIKTCGKELKLLRTKQEEVNTKLRDTELEMTGLVNKLQGYCETLGIEKIEIDLED